MSVIPVQDKLSKQNEHVLDTSCLHLAWAHPALAAQTLRAHLIGASRSPSAHQTQAKLSLVK